MKKDRKIPNPVLNEKEVREWWTRQIAIVNKPNESAKGAEDGIQQSSPGTALDQQEKQTEESTLPRYNVYDAR